MADIGVIGTDQEYALMVAGFKGAGDFGSISKEAIIIRTVEAALRREMQFPLDAETVTNEEYSIEFPIIQNDVMISRRTSFMLRRAPIASWDALKIATARDATTGAVSSTQTLPRNSYHVELSTGLVRELNWTLIQGFLLQLWPEFSFPAGTMNLLASYHIAAISGDISAAAKAVAFMAANRLFKKFQNNSFDVMSISIDGMSTTYLSKGFFTDMELSLIKPFKKGVFPSFH